MVTTVEGWPSTMRRANRASAAPLPVNVCPRASASSGITLPSQGRSYVWGKGGGRTAV